MSVGSLLPEEVRALAQAVGLLDEDGDIRPSWFEHPIDDLRKVLQAGAQRAALLDLLARIVPPEGGGTPRRHPLLPAGLPGQLYLLVDPQSDGVRLGVAGQVRATGTPGVRLEGSCLLLRASNAGLELVAGTSQAPLQVRLRVDAALSGALDLAAVEGTLDAVLQGTPRVGGRLAFLGLGLGDAAPRDVVFDTAAPGPDVVELLLALVTDAVAAVPALARLPAALGQVAGLPRLRLDRLATDPGVLRGWFEQLRAEGKLGTWLGHVAALLGLPALTGSGTSAAPFRVALVDDPGLGAAVTVVLEEGRLRPGLSLRAAPAAGLHLYAEAVACDLPLAGQGAVVPLPSLQIGLQAAGPGAGDPAAVFRVDALRAGIGLRGGQPAPVLELLGVRFQGTTHPRVDLTRLEGLSGLAGAAVQAALSAALGDSPLAHRVLRVAGLEAPPGVAAGWPLLDLLAFVTDPLGALGGFFRSSFAHVDGFGPVLGELCGQSGAATGVGTREDPWRVELAQAGPVAVQLAAWRAAGDRLAIALRITAASAPFTVAAEAALVELTLPAAGAPGLALPLRLTARAVVEPLPAAEGLAADALTVSLDWVPGQAPAWSARLAGIRLSVGGVALPAVQLQLPAAIDFSTPAAAAASLGLATAELEAFIRGLVARALALWGDVPGAALAALLGLQDGLLGLPAGLPRLTAPAGGSLLTDPLAAVRPWLASLARTVLPDGRPALAALLPVVAGLLEGALPAGPQDAVLPGFSPTGRGTAESPWVLPAGPARLLLWLGPDGPPWAAVAPLVAAAGAGAEAFAQAAIAAAGALPALALRLPAEHRDRLTNGLEQVAALLAEGDGVVPALSASPPVPGWTTLPAVAATAGGLLASPAAVAAITAQVAAFASAGPAPLVLLLSVGAANWSSLTAAAGEAPTAFDLRQADTPPEQVDLTAISAVTGWYAVALAPADRTGLGAQVTRLIDRLDALQPGRPVIAIAQGAAGFGARRAAVARPARLAGLVAVGTPFLGAAAPWATDVSFAAVLSVFQHLRAHVPAGLARDALDAGLLGAVAEAAEPDLASGGVPVATLAGQLGAIDLVGALAPALAALAPGAAAGPALPALPDHLGVGVELDLVAQRTAGLNAHVTLRGALAEVGLDGARPPARAAVARVVLERPAGFLVEVPGGPRVRRATLELRLAADALALAVTLDDAALGGLPGPRDLADPAVQALLGRVFDAIATEPAAAPVFDLLGALGLTTGQALSIDALAALANPGGLAWLAPRLRAALATGLGGLRLGTPLALGPLTLSLDPATFALTLGTAGVTLAGGLGVRGGLTLALPSLAPTADVAVVLGDASVRFTPGHITLEAPRWMAPLTLQPAPADLPAQLGARLGRLLFSAASSALISSLLPPGLNLGALDRLLGAGPRPAAGAGPGRPDPGVVAALLQSLDGLLGNAPGPGLRLPAGLQVTATDDAGATVVRLATSAPLGGVFSADLGLRFEGGRVGPQVSVGLTLPLATWNPLGIQLELRADGPRFGLVLPGPTPVELYPHFGGIAALMAGGQALLPAVLDQLVAAVPASAVRAAALDVATTLGLYDAVGGFAAHVPAFQALLDGGFDVQLPATRAALANALRALLGLVPGVPAPTGAGTTLAWTTTVAGTAVTVGLDWAAAVPGLTLAVARAADPVTVQAELAVGPGGVTVSGSVVAANLLELGINPAISFGFSGSQPTLVLKPLAKAGGDGPLVLALLPTPALTARADLATRLALDALLPLGASLLGRVAPPPKLWATGPTVEAFLRGSGLFQAGSWGLASPLPSIPALLAGLIGTLSASLPIGGTDLTVTLGDQAGTGVGVGLKGTLAIPLGDTELRLLFGRARPGTSERVALVLFSGGAFAPRLVADGFGLGLAGREAPLIRTDFLRLGGVDAFTWFDVGFAPVSASFRGAGLALNDVSLPVSQATSGGGNPVVGALMGGGGGGGGGQPAQPTIGVAAEVYQGVFDLKLNGDAGPLWIGVRSSFGPLYIEQVGVAITQAGGHAAGVSLLIDGGVVIAGLSIQVDDLSLTIPFQHFGDPSRWSVDLQGLAIGFEAPGISIAGGLRKGTRTPTPTEPGGVEYTGMLMVKVDSFGLVAIGSYGAFTDAEGDFDSFFLFAGLFAVIGVPPLLEIRGLGVGFGYNRRLLVPEEVTKIPDFFLVSALDDPARLTSSPMDVLREVQAQVPARRGSLWFALGFHGTTFVVVHVTAAVYVALDRGVEIGLIGVARMALPTDDSALVSIELALKARYSSEEQLLSIQAQLTDNSWLLSRDCQLTGGFAFFAWFKKGQFVLTLGGYHPAFQRPPEFPEVPRLGFRWQLGGALVIKGESYFALTNSCVMAGLRFEAAYDIGWLRAWFKAWADFLLSWDPFHYDISIGVSLGARFKLRINLLFGTVTISFSFSVGGTLHVLGPPLHGTVTAVLGPISITVPFGPDPDDEPNYLTWQDFRLKYLLGDDAAARAVDVQAGSGLLPVEPPGGRPAPGTQAQPWRFGTEFSLSTDTRMPASALRAFDDVQPGGAGVTLSAAPMGEGSLTASHEVRLVRRAGGAEHVMSFDPALVDRPQDQLDRDRFVIKARRAWFPEAVWRFVAGQKPAAASRNIEALAGLDIQAVAEPLNRIGPIDVAKLRDEGPKRPLPFAGQGAGVLAGVRADGRLAAALVQDLKSTRAIAEAIVARAGAFEDVRQALGLTAGGLSGPSVAALRRRAAPPRAASLAEGLTLEPPRSGAQPRIAHRAAVHAVPLRAPRLLLAMRLPAAPAQEVRRASTSVSNAPELRRIAPPRLPAESVARLLRVPGADTPRPTRASVGAVLDRHPALGQVASRRSWAAREDLEARVTRREVRLDPHVAQIWQIPPGRAVLQAEASGALRVVALAASGAVLADVDVHPRRLRELPLPDGTAQVALVALGRPHRPFETRFAAAQWDAGPVGWQADSPLVPVGGGVFLARGARVAVHDANARSLDGVTARQLLAGAAVVETWLPRVQTVAIRLDPVGACAAEAPEILVEGGTLGAPLVVEGDSGPTWLFAVGRQKADTLHLTIQGQRAFRVAGVVGLRGTPEENASRLTGRFDGALVSTAPLSADGAVAIRLKLEGEDHG